MKKETEHNLFVKQEKENNLFKLWRCGYVYYNEVQYNGIMLFIYIKTYFELTNDGSEQGSSQNT